jgi:hypothetical protein
MTCIDRRHARRARSLGRPLFCLVCSVARKLAGDRSGTSIDRSTGTARVFGALEMDYWRARDNESHTPARRQAQLDDSKVAIHFAAGR